MRFVHSSMVLLLIWGSVAADIQAQKEDYHWCLGYNGESRQFTPPFGGIDFVFSEDSVIIKYAQRSADFDDCNASICDEEGNLLLYTNGIYAGNGQNETLFNGRGLDEWTITGNQARQGALILPMPGTAGDTFVIVHNFMDIVSHNGKIIGGIFQVFSSYVDLTFMENKGKIYEKRNLIVEDTIKWGITTVRHANGRDWWIPIIRDKGDFGFMCLLDPKGINVVDTFYFDFRWMRGSGQVHFTPDGNKYVQVFSNNINEGYYLDVMDFDRCTGNFSNRTQIKFQDTINTFGCAISSNSRFVYAAAFDEIHQYDLWSNDLEGSREVVAVEDGFETIPGFNRLWFRSMGLGPNGKIYVSGPGTTQHLHTIHAPDSSGLDCRVGLHDIELPAYTFSTMPNIPNHRLGPVDGSLCDSLGIDNLPLARFRHTGQNLGKQFLDLSSYEPSQWFWDFGDGATSMERQPYHVYQRKGIYKVCLTVSNAFGQDSTCRPVLVDTSIVSSRKNQFSHLVKFYPSPSKGQVVLDAPDQYFPCILVVRNANGQIVHQEGPIHSSNTNFTFGSISPGIYTIQLTKDDRIVWQDTWVKI